MGYGDYAGGTSREYMVSICFEFVGFCYNAVLISTMSNVFANETTFDQLLDARMNELDSWMNRLQLSYKSFYMHAKLGKQISLTVQDAFRMDNNLIVEEYDLYQQLPPKMQTELVKLIFGKFISRFKHFFNSCEVGFRNEFII